MPECPHEVIVVLLAAEYCDLLILVKADCMLVLIRMQQSLRSHGHSPLTSAFAFPLPWPEAIVGCLGVIGLFTRAALRFGPLVMILLMFGTCLVQDWQAAERALLRCAAPPSGLQPVFD